MKINRLLLITITGLAPALAFGVAPRATPNADKANSRVEVVFLEPEKYTDVRGTLNDPGDRNGHLDQLRDHVVKIAEEYLPAGQKLQLTFTDIDLAGDFPPGKPASVDHVRVMKDIYPPRMVFSYRVMDAAGIEIRSGRAELTDNNYMTTGRLAIASDALRYDKKLLSDWFQKEIAGR